jgi:hypothetical protein
MKARVATLACTLGQRVAPIHLFIKHSPARSRAEGKQPPHRLETTSIASSSSEVRTESSEILPLKAKMQLSSLYEMQDFDQKVGYLAEISTIILSKVN